MAQRNVMTLAGSDNDAIIRRVNAVLRHDMPIFAKIYNDTAEADGSDPVLDAADPIKNYRTAERVGNAEPTPSDTPEVYIYTETIEQQEQQFTNGLFSELLNIETQIVNGVDDKNTVNERYIEYDAMGDEVYSAVLLEPDADINVGLDGNSTDTNKMRVLSVEESAVYKSNIFTNCILDVLNRYCGRQGVPYGKIVGVTDLTYQSHALNFIEQLQNSAVLVNSIITYSITTALSQYTVEI